MTHGKIFRNALLSKKFDLQGSVARDHLANERTFLAWIRTGFATAALGVIIARLPMMSPVNQSGAIFFKILALIFILVGGICLMSGSYRYANVQYSMEHGQYLTNGLLVTLVAILGLFAFLATFVVILIK